MVDYFQVCYLKGVDNMNKNFAVVGYDKDNDVYDDLMLDTLEKCQEAVEIFKPLILKGRLISTCREAYDWLEIWDYNKNECIEVIDLV